MQAESFDILLAEDNEAHAELVIRGLQAQRTVNRLWHVADGVKALDYLFRRGEYADPKSSPVPHLVLLDLRLPRLDGLEVLQQIKQSEALRHLPVVVLSTSDAERDVSRAYATHANSYLVKPIDFDEFSSLMKDLGSYWSARNLHPW